MKKIFLMSVFASLFVVSGVSTSFARDYHNDGRKNYYTKDGKYDYYHYRDHKFSNNRDYKHYKDKRDHHRFNKHRKQFAKNKWNKKYSYRHDNGYHYGHRHKRYNRDHNIWNTLFFGYVFK